MARARSLDPYTLVRASLREAIRSGHSVTDAVADASVQFESTPANVISRVAGQEARRQSAVDRVMSRDFRRRTNMHAIAGCGAGESVVARITVTWYDDTAGRSRTYGHTTTLANQGVMSSILNTAIQEVIDDARGRGYTPPRVTSAMTSGAMRYRIEYIECR